MSLDYCPHCGASVSAALDAFCMSCREPLDEPPAKALPISQRPLRLEGIRLPWWAIFVAIFVAIKLLFWMVWVLQFLSRE